MKTKLLSKLTCLMFFICCVSFGQTNLFKVEPSKGIVKTNTYTIDINQLNNVLKQAPQRNNSKGKTKLIIEIPNLDGNLEKFYIEEASVMAPELQAKYPEIRSYAGQGVDSPTSFLRFSISPYKGFSGIVISGENESSRIIEPVKENLSKVKIFKGRDTASFGGSQFICATPEDLKDAIEQKTNNNSNKSANNVLHTFDLALSVTGEYTAYHGGTLAGANAAIVATMTRVNSVFETDFNVTLVLVANNDSIIYLDENTDPYSPATTGQDDHVTYGGAPWFAANWQVELQDDVLTPIIGEANYDIGHLFGATGGGGNAGCIGCICESSPHVGGKGSAYTSPADGIPEGDTFDIDYVAHEMGHQFGANHTFTHSSEGNGVAQMEPGSGTTIMGYAGITGGTTDVQSNSDPYFHAISIKQVTDHVATRSCDVETTITNAIPVANAGSNYTLPRGTPFKLTGSATDADAGDVLTYCWEQYDEANGQGGGIPSETDSNSNSPQFRSYSPRTDPTRTIPVMADLLQSGVNGTSWEKIPTVARTADFRLTVRDNKIGGAANDFDDMMVTWVNTAGPFLVTSQNTDQIVWTTGNTETITWDVAGTTANGVNTANVNILLSIDGGLTFDTILATNVTNNGSYDITVPNVSAPYCRIMVEGAGNIFFNINSEDFAIGDYTYTAQNVCKDFVFDLNAVITESADNSYPATILPIEDSFTITDIKTYADITHPNIGEVDILFWFPWSTSLNTGIWYQETSCTNADMDKWFDLAGTVADCNTNGGSPFLPFSAGNFTGAIGENSAGDWRIYFKDAVVNGSGGTLNTFTIQLCGEETLPLLSTETFELFDDSVVVYPNPNNGEFNIKFTSVSNNVEISVFDIRGRSIYGKTYDNSSTFNESINIGNVQSGIYLLNVKDGSRTVTKKIIVE